jgi:hypothetical protein
MSDNLIGFRTRCVENKVKLHTRYQCRFETTTNSKVSVDTYFDSIVPERAKELFLEWIIFWIVEKINYRSARDHGMQMRDGTIVFNEVTLTRVYDNFLQYPLHVLESILCAEIEHDYE